MRFQEVLARERMVKMDFDMAGLGAWGRVLEAMCDGSGGPGWASVCL